MNPISAEEKNIQQQARIFAVFDFLCVSTCIFYGVFTSNLGVVLISAGAGCLAIGFFLLPVDLRSRLETIFAAGSVRIGRKFWPKLLVVIGLALCLSGCILVFLR